MQWLLSSSGATCRAKRSFDRTLYGAVAASLLVHALLLGALCLLARTGRDGSRPLGAPSKAVAMEVELVAPVSDGRPPRGDAIPASSVPLPPRASPSVAAQAPPAETIVQARADTAPALDGGASVDPPAAKAVATSDPAAGEEYRRALLDHILIYRRPPERADRVDRDGTVMVHFSVTRGGGVQALMIAASSGNPDLDDEAIATIWRACPMPQIPPALPDRLSVTLPVTFMVGRAQVPG